MGKSGRKSNGSAPSTPSRPPFPLSLKSSPSVHTTPPSSEPKSARSSLINVLTRPRHTPASSLDHPSLFDEEFSDQSTISSYASSSSSGSRSGSSEDIAKYYKNYLEKPFVHSKSTIKHSEFGHCNNPNWRWTSQVSSSLGGEYPWSDRLMGQWNPNEPISAEGEATPPYFVLFTTYMA